MDSNTVIEGTVKFRDGKKWKSRWCVMRKLSPVADCLHLQLYRDSKDRYKQGQTKASLSLQHFLGVESGFTLDKESNTIAIICQDVTVILAFDTRERLIQWQVKISNNLGDDQQFLIQITSAPPKAKIATGPARLHVMDQRFCITTGVPPRLVGFWEIGQLRRYGVVEGRFCFEGGSRCGRGEGLHVCVTDQGDEITTTFQLAAQGKLAARRRPVARKLSAMDSPRKQLLSRPDTRASDLSCADSLVLGPHGLAAVAGAAGVGGLCAAHDECVCALGLAPGGPGLGPHGNDAASRHPSAEDLLCPCHLHHGTSSPFWSSAESAAGHHNADLDSNYGCGDTASVSELHDPPYHLGDAAWAEGGGGAGGLPERRPGGLPPALERCASCISKLGAPSMSRSSTATNTNTPTAGMAPFSPAWTMDCSGQQSPLPAQPAPPNGAPPSGPTAAPGVPCLLHFPRAASSCDRSSLSSHSSSSGGASSSEYCVPRFSGTSECWYDRPRPANAAPPTVPPKSPKPPAGTPQQCPCCPPGRPPKPPQMARTPSVSERDSPSKKKPPMPLPLQTPQPAQQPVCLCHHFPGVVLSQPLQQPLHPPGLQQRSDIGPYENYDVPKPFLAMSGYAKDPSKEEPKPEEHRMSISSQSMDEYYDTPKSIKDSLSTSMTCDTQYGNYDTPPVVKTLRKPCGCIIKYTTKKSVVVTSQIETSKFVVEHEQTQAITGGGGGGGNGSCPCHRVMCWAENWMMLPYCRRGNGMENTGVPIHKVKLSGEGKMPVVNASGEIAIYATVDKSKKTNRRAICAPEASTCRDGCSCPSDVPNHLPTCVRSLQDSSNYVNVEPERSSDNPAGPEGCNYENIDFAQSLEYYENAKDVVQRAGITQQEAEAMAGEIDSRGGEEPPVSYTINNGVKFCNKCGHACHMLPQRPTPDNESQSPGVQSEVPKQDDYLMMEPAKKQQPNPESGSKNFPGYLPMSPITNPNASCNKLQVDSQSGLPSEKSASIPSLAGPAVDRSRKRADSEFPRVPGSAMMVMHHSANSPYLRRLLMDAGDDTRRTQLLSRKRSSSADSSRYLDGCDDFDSGDQRHISASQNKLTNPEPRSTPVEPEVLPAEEAQPVEEPTAEEVPVAPEAQEEEEEEATAAAETDSGSASSGSLRTLVRESNLDRHPDATPAQEALSPSAVYIRRSSSVPCKSGNNRDSSSSNDSGVSTGSLRQRGADFAEFELPLTTSMSARRHHHALSRHPGPVTNCLHASLPRRSKSVDPLRELSFQFQKVKIPAKSSSAEAEVPICPTKRDGTKGFQSPGADGAIVVPYMDSRSTSSGTSDMSDYIETLSLSSHSSSDTPDSLRLGRPATTTLRPRSGKEYQLIDRSILEGDLKGHCPGPTGNDKVSHQLRGLVAPYANITPVPEKSESPSPGYMSGSPGQEREDQPLIPHTHTYHK